MDNIELKIEQEIRKLLMDIKYLLESIKETNIQSQKLLVEILFKEIDNSVKD